MKQVLFIGILLLIVSGILPSSAFFTSFSYSDDDDIVLTIFDTKSQEMNAIEVQINITAMEYVDIAFSYVHEGDMVMYEIINETGFYIREATTTKFEIQFLEQEIASVDHHAEGSYMVNIVDDNIDENLYGAGVDLPFPLFSVFAIPVLVIFRKYR